MDISFCLIRSPSSSNHPLPPPLPPSPLLIVFVFVSLSLLLSLLLAHSLAQTKLYETNKAMVFAGMYLQVYQCMCSSEKDQAEERWREGNRVCEGKIESECSRESVCVRVGDGIHSDERATEREREREIKPGQSDGMQPFSIIFLFKHFFAKFVLKNLGLIFNQNLL